MLWRCLIYSVCKGPFPFLCASAFHELSVCPSKYSLRATPDYILRPHALNVLEGPKRPEIGWCPPEAPHVRVLNDPWLRHHQSTNQTSPRLHRLKRQHWRKDGNRRSKFTFNRRFYPKRLTIIHIYTVAAAMQGADKHIRSSSGVHYVAQGDFNMQTRVIEPATFE